MELNRNTNVKDLHVSPPFGNTLLCAVISWSEITQKLNKVAGRYFVYLLIKDDEVIYVGRSFNLSSRLSWHKYRKDFDTIYLVE